METIEVSADFLLEDMMKKLKLPAPTYKTYAEPFCQFDTTVTFYPSERYLKASLPPHSLRSYPRRTLEESVTVAARAAIRYMESDEKKALKDYNYDELERAKKRIKRLQSQLKRKNAKLTETSSQLTNAMISCEIYTDHVFVVKDQLDKILTDKLVQRSGAAHSSSGSVIADIQKAKNDLDRHTKEAIRSFKATGAYPLNYDYAASSSSTDYGTDDSEAFHRKSEIYDFDSDGNLIDSDYVD